MKHWLVMAMLLQDKTVYTLEEGEYRSGFISAIDPDWLVEVSRVGFQYTVSSDYPLEDVYIENKGYYYSLESVLGLIR